MCTRTLSLPYAKIFVWEEDLFVLGGKINFSRGTRRICQPLTFAVKYFKVVIHFTSLPHYTVPDCKRLARNTRKRVCWLDRLSSDMTRFLLFLARRLLPVDSSAILINLCLGSNFVFICNTKNSNLNKFSHLKHIFLVGPVRAVTGPWAERSRASHIFPICY